MVAIHLSRMEVRLLESTENPEEVICAAARNDYLAGWIGDMSFEEIMSPIEGDDIEAKKARFIGQLLKRGHYGPFEHAQATFTIRGVSRACMAQLTRHRHVSFDVQSMRYVAFDDVDPDDVREGEMVVTPPSATDPNWVGRKQKTFDADNIERREEIFRESVARSVEEYQELLDLGMPPEDARLVLPIGSKVNITMSLNARMLMHVADMRAAADAQWEIRELTEEVLSHAEKWCPHTFKYYDEHMKNRKNRLAP